MKLYELHGVFRPNMKKRDFLFSSALLPFFAKTAKAQSGSTKMRSRSVFFATPGSGVEVLDDSASIINQIRLPRWAGLSDAILPGTLVASLGTGIILEYKSGVLKTRGLSESVFGIRDRTNSWRVKNIDLPDEKLNSILSSKILNSNYDLQIKLMALGAVNHFRDAHTRGIYFIRHDNSLHYQSFSWSESLNSHYLIDNPVLLTSQIACTSFCAAGDGLLFFVVNGSLKYYIDQFYDSRHFPFPPYNSPLNNFSPVDINIPFQNIAKVCHGGDNCIYLWLLSGDIYRIIYNTNNPQIFSTLKIAFKNYDPLSQFIGEFASSNIPLAGYCWPLSASAGQKLDFFVGSQSSEIVTQIIKFDWNPNSNSLQEVSLNSPSYIRNVQPARIAHIMNQDQGCNWPIVQTLRIPDNWISGYYFLKLTSKTSRPHYIPFVVKNSSSNRAPILLLANTNTWNAYNTCAINGNYSEGRLAANTFKRPMNIDPTSLNGGPVEGLPAEVYFQAWLKFNGFNFDVITDYDLHSVSYTRLHYKCLVMPGHPEYFSTQQRNNLVNYLSSGGNLAYLGGNALYEKIDYTQSGQIIYTKFNAFRTLGMSERQVLGVAYEGAAAFTFSGYKVLPAAVNHWTFANTGVTSQQSFGTSSLRGINIGASGGEFDVMDFNSSQYQGLIHLAKGQNSANGQIVGADMIIFPFGSNGAQVFSTSSTNYTFSCFSDSVISNVTRNVLNAFTAG